MSLSVHEIIYVSQFHATTDCRVRGSTGDDNKKAPRSTGLEPVLLGGKKTGRATLSVRVGAHRVTPLDF